SRGPPATAPGWRLCPVVAHAQAGGGGRSQGKPPACGWGVVSRLGLGGGESPRQGAGRDGRTSPRKDTHPGHVGPAGDAPPCLRALANRVCPGAAASATAAPEAGTLHVRDGTGGAG